MYQHTVSKEFTFEGKGLHTGRISRMTVKPAPADSGIVFRRTDLGENAIVKAIAANVSNTARSTTISEGEVSVSTIEHIMSALIGFGVDNALIDIDNVEVPILDGSARLYAEAFNGNVVSQDAEKHFLEIDKVIEIKDEKTGSYVRITPAQEPSFDLTVDFGSHVLGVQKAHWDLSADYANEIAPCRTFVFFHEIEFLFNNNLIKGGDVDNAIVIVEKPVAEETLARMSEAFGFPDLKISEGGYLNNLQLHFPNECGRHKLLDLIGDMSLAGGVIKAHIEAYKPGHTINTAAAKAVAESLIK